MSTIPDWMKDTLRSLRIKFGYSQSEAALLLGISKKTLQLWEKNSGVVSFSKMEVIEEVYNTPRDYIFFGDESAFSEIMKRRVI
ncbi:helix-turn-helix transcriptional regulator [Paenibacillus popilliae]|uniref:Predicted transcriptional regulator n=1 Tax=Paenibacillus popilliae ATCC 14706 TaxID=1212764 RepID=M9LIA8_PAEPP|nr:helix-turn-helix transcriptional regulator [Paenibacillus popilliae]GAC42765.1 predicted transcriptional regulator [Paenibacillus popilliae ATCC 14706]